MMADENRDQQTEDRSQDESRKTQPARSEAGGPAAATKTAQDNDDVQAYGEPSDGSGGTKDGGA